MSAHRHVTDAGLATLVDVARHRALDGPDRPAYGFLPDNGADELTLSYAELDLHARAIGAWLREHGATGQGVLLLYPPGLQYVAALFGCLYAGAIAVPAYPSRPNRSVARINAILLDAKPSIALTTSALLADMQERLGASSPGVRWLATDGVATSAAAEWQRPPLDGETVAILQYTSGSTSAPKGVVLTHSRLLANLRAIQTCFGHGPDDHGVIWLPPYHDMGLIGGVLQACYVGASVTLMSPTSFLQRPARWLEAVSRTRATTSGGPDFAFDLCVRNVTPEQREQLDLRHWRVAFCGAEPVRKTTLDRFASAFAPCGFRREALYPCYGLAESTLIVSGGLPLAGPVSLVVSRAELARDRVLEAAAPGTDTQTLIGCGQAAAGHRIEIVRPESGRRCSAGEVGEIWVAGPSVAAGYWNRPDETREGFEARLDTGEGPFLRTGDLGFVRAGELFVTGRLKDLIIIRGRNFYPHDIELTAQSRQPSLRPHSVVAFSARLGDDEERLVLVQEVEGSRRHAVNVEAVARTIRQAVVEEHDVTVDAVVLVERLSIPRTSSGKPQRLACRTAFQNGTLQAVAEWRAPLAAQAPPREPPPEPPPDPSAVAARGAAGERGETEIVRWLVTQIARQTGLDAHAIDITQPFASFGMDSVQAVRLSVELSDWLGRETPPTLVYDFPTIESLARHLADDARRPDPAVPSRSDAHAAADGAASEGIAIIGMGCRFPGADGPEAFWRLLHDGVDAITEVPPTRWDAAALYDSDVAAPGKMNTRWGGFLEHIDRFDPLFFGISPREAERIDPQQRLLLEVAWEALEDAGQAADKLAGSATGVYVGISTNDYGQMQLADPALSDPYVGTGSAPSIAANRISYALDLRGPSVALDTACSSSLVAVHLACRSLESGECTLALAGGVNVMTSPALTVNFSKAGFMAPDGRCKAFDARANGYVRGEGAGVVVLKRLSRALADGDPVYAVIRGSAINQDGRTNGLTAPSGAAQEAVLRASYERAGIDPARVQYVEAHGTGTALGDPIEAAALGRALGGAGGRTSRCAVGSVKSNIGHLEAAAGVAGLIKVALCIRHRMLVPTLHFREANPHISFEKLGLRVQESRAPWTGGTEARVAGVSSFGFGGTNAHLVLEEPPASPVRTDPPATDGAVHVLPISARSRRALESLAHGYRDLLEGAATPLHDVCYTAALRRSHLEHRLAVVGRSHDELRRALDAASRDGATASGAHARRPGALAFVFSGQGTQWPRMGADLLEREPVFRASIEACDAVMARHVRWSLVDEMRAGAESSRLDSTEIAQPAIFALQVALTALFRSWGVAPDIVVGHSVGEVAAAHVAGALRLDDAVRLVLERGRLMQRGHGAGAMAAVRLPAAEADRLVARFGGALSVAAINDPESTVLSGEREALQEVLAELERRGVPGRPLGVDFAFHSGQMEPHRVELERALRGIEPGMATIPLVSTVTGGRARGPELGASHWASGIRQPVRFAAAMDALVDAGCTAFLEVGANPALAVSMAECLRARGVEGVVATTLRREGDGSVLVREALAALYTARQPVQWRALFPQGGRCVRLPATPWQRSRYWADGGRRPGAVAREERTAAGTPTQGRLLGRRLPEVAHAPGAHVWESELHSRSAPYIAAHRIQGISVLPMGAYLELMLAACDEALGGTAPRLTDVELRQLLFLPDEGTRRVQVVVTPGPDGDARVLLYARHGGQGDESSRWEVHAAATARRSDRSARPHPVAPVRALDFGLMFFSASDDALGRDGYRLLIEGARFADTHDFSSVLVPERHFSKFGCLYPNPAVLHAALARETSRVRLRAGSVVLPLHDPLRVAEEWAMVDNLSGGRVELSFASGWHPNDFVLFPDRYAGRHDEMLRGIDTVRRLWRGETMSLRNGVGETVAVRTYPTPVQRELPIWITAAGTPSTFERAGALGANLLTHLLDQSLETLAGRITLYRDARARAGHDPRTGRVAVMLHTFLGDDIDAVREEVRGPYCDYLKSIAHLLSGFAQSKGRQVDVASLSPEELDAFVNFLFERFYSTRALLGTPESCLELTRELAAIGVDEAACLLDFGADTETILQHLPHLDRLRRLSAAEAPRGARAAIEPELVRRRCTTELAGEEYARLLRAGGIDDAAVLGAVERIWRRDGEAIARLRLACDACAAEATVRPIVLASCLHVLLAAVPGWPVGPHAGDAPRELDYVPAGLADVEISAVSEKATLWAHAELRAGRFGDAHLEGDVRVLDDSGQTVADLRGIRFLRLSDIATPNAATEGDARHAEAEVDAADVDDLLYELRWVPQVAAEPSGPPSDCLILADAGGVGEALAARWSAAGGVCTVVTWADALGGSAPARGAPSLEAMRAVLARAGDGVPSRVVHLWSLDAPLAEDADLASLEAAQVVGVESLLSLLQAVHERARAGGSLVWAVTRGAQSVGERQEPVNAAQAPLWGLGRVAAAELSGVWGGTIDICPRAGVVDAAAQLAEVLEKASNENQLAIRDGQRFVPRLVRQDTTSYHRVQRLRDDASYLVTGGGGDLGLEVARWMVDRGARHLVLVGRSLSERRAHAEPGNQTATTRPTALAALSALERAGASVHTAAVDVADERQLRALLQRLEREGVPPIRGVVHAAGVVRGATLLRMSSDDLWEVLRPKVLGGWALHRAFASAQLDFFVGFSAIPSLLGWIGEGAANYAAANAFLDGLAHYQRARRMPGQSIAWGPWGQVGMAARAPGALEGLASLGVGSISPAQGRRVLERLLLDGPAQTAAVRLDWPRFLEATGASRAPLLSGFGGGESRGVSAAPERGGPAASLPSSAELLADPQRGRRLLERRFAEQLGAVLKIAADDFPLDEPLTRMGLDSLVAIDLKARVQAALGVSIPLVMLLQGPSIAGLAEHVLSTLASTTAAAAPPPPERAPHSSGGIGSREAGELLSRIDELSDQDIDRLLREVAPVAEGGE